MKEKTKILLVDDEQEILEFMSYNLERNGYEVQTASNGHSALKIARNFVPDLIILDVMMPGMDGIETCQQLRLTDESKDALIVFLTARGEDYSQIAGFEAGSDDYLVKPVSIKVILSRINALLRRRHNSSVLVQTDQHEEDIFIDRENYLVLKNNEEIILPRKEFEILSLISSRPNRLFRREEIFNNIWGTDTFVGERTIDVYIRKLRSKIGDEYIRTIKGVGYKYTPPQVPVTN